MSIVRSISASSVARATFSGNVLVWVAAPASAWSFSMSLSISSNCGAVAATRSCRPSGAASKRGWGSGTPAVVPRRP